MFLATHFMTSCTTGLVRSVNRSPSTAIITSHHVEKTGASLKGLCIREIVTKIIILLINEILHYSTTVFDAMEICFIIIQHVLIRPEFI